jgi:hypothetical protein
MRRFRTHCSLLVYCFQALKGDLELESESVAAALHQRQEFKFQFPMFLHLFSLSSKNTGTYSTVLHSHQENLLIEIEFGGMANLFTISTSLF